ncbi:hypothetical protein CRUP_012633, partial [Coryphaenoides rupestris]
ACPPVSLKVCALRMQLFIGLRSMCVLGRHVMLLSAADVEAPEEAERSSHQRTFMSKKWVGSRPKQPSTTGHGWNLYVVDTVSPITLYHEMVEYSCRYAETHPKGQSCRHLLSEAHLILRALLVQPLPPARGAPGERPPGPTGGEEAQGPPGGNMSARTDSEADRRVLEKAFSEN